jgi:hypothetical protein
MPRKGILQGVLLEHANRQGAVTEMDLVPVTAQTMGCTEVKVQCIQSMGIKTCSPWGYLRRPTQLFGVEICEQMLGVSDLFPAVEDCSMDRSASPG